ncbi:hypothetical protein GCM10009819_20570 [Agromyces tropicus]|uniref:Excalibur calcium-binding domain-containing protein n=1 Tax=Agromyces tropicus TaxID=555371 RepID=A0ABN2UF88_9MICO
MTVLVLGCVLMLSGCSGQVVADADEAAAAEAVESTITPTPSATPSPTPTPAPEPEPELEPEPEPEAKPEPEPAPKPATDPRFDTCGDAIDAGYGPYIRGVDPEYDWYRDGDKDGDVCES